jgi:NADH-quinone oxidoreductase subunit M
MILAVMIVVLLAAGLLAWPAERLGRQWPRAIALVALAADLGLALALWARPADAGSGWLAEVAWPWIPALGVSIHLAADGMSLLLVLLTAVLGLVAVGASWNEVRERVGFFHLNLLWVLAGVLGVFLALDLFLFYFFWELMLVPMYFLIALWGHERRAYAAIKFFLFTQASGLLMLLAILGLYFAHAAETGVYTFGYPALLGTPLAPGTERWLMLGFFVAFAVKLPAVPLHTWLPDAHTEAPTAGSVILAGLLLKTGAYGLLRFALPLFPDASREFAPIGMALGVAGILYGGMLAFAQTDLKRLVAYTSVSHLGFVLLGAYAWNELALQGAVLGMIAHGLSTGALFVLAGALQERLHTRDLREMGGLWDAMPRMGGVTMVFALASLGLPGLANFVAEFLVLLGAYRASVPLTVLAAVGLVVATVYSLALVQRVFHGPPGPGLGPPGPGRAPLADLSRREMALVAPMIALVVWLGLHPQPVLDTSGPALQALERLAGGAGVAQR